MRELRRHLERTQWERDIIEWSWVVNEFWKGILSPHRFYECALTGTLNSMPTADMSYIKVPLKAHSQKLVRTQVPLSELNYDPWSLYDFRRSWHLLLFPLLPLSWDAWLSSAIKTESCHCPLASSSLINSVNAPGRKLRKTRRVMALKFLPPFIITRHAYIHFSMSQYSLGCWDIIMVYWDSCKHNKHTTEQKYLQCPKSSQPLSNIKYLEAMTLVKFRILPSLK